MTGGRVAKRQPDRMDLPALHLEPPANSFTRSGSLAFESAENNVVLLSSQVASPPPAPPAHAVTAFGLPLDAFSRAWTAQDLQAYLGIGRTQAYQLLRDPSAPPHLRAGGSRRWNGLQIMAWLHHQDWRDIDRGFVDASPEMRHSVSTALVSDSPELKTATPTTRSDPPSASHLRSVSVPSPRASLGGNPPDPANSEPFADADTERPHATRVVVIDPAEEQKRRNESWARQLTAPRPTNRTKSRPAPTS